MPYKEVSRAIIFDESYRIFLAKRARGRGAGQWALIGGKPEGGESSNETVCREVFEETGLLYEPTLFKEEIDSSHDENSQPWRVSYFIGRATGKLVLDRLENSEADYFPREVLPTLDIAFGHIRIIEEFLNSI